MSKLLLLILFITLISYTNSLKIGYNCSEVFNKDAFFSLEKLQAEEDYVLPIKK